MRSLRRGDYPLLILLQHVNTRRRPAAAPRPVSLFLKICMHNIQLVCVRTKPPTPKLNALRVPRLPPSARTVRSFFGSSRRTRRDHQGRVDPRSRFPRYGVQDEPEEETGGYIGLHLHRRRCRTRGERGRGRLRIMCDSMAVFWSSVGTLGLFQALLSRLYAPL